MECLQFIIDSGKVCISDPCYDRKTWCAAWDLPAENGIWNCEVVKENCGAWGSRVKQISCTHDSIENNQYMSWERLDFDIGVDSGQCGIFDSGIYPNDNTGECFDLNTFYGKCCYLTVPELRNSTDDDTVFGVLEKGIVSSSGFGDGSYTAYGLYNKENEKLLGVRVVFIDDEEEEIDYET